MEDNTSFLAKKSRIRIGDLQEAKTRGEKWAMLTCYDTISARIFDQAKIPCLLVGDSAAQMVYGYKSTIPITMDEMIPLARAVASSCSRALVIADLPFGSYQGSPQDALAAASRFMKEAGVHGVKLEGGKDYVSHVELLTKAGIPVMAHIGFTPQSEHSLSGYKIQGRDVSALQRIKDDAEALQKAGAFSCVIEMVPSLVGSAVSSHLKIPTVGIGAGPDCDAQVLVWQDMAGFVAPSGGSQYLADSSGEQGASGLKLGRTPKFVKRYANMSEILFKSAQSFLSEVKSGKYPAEEHCYD